MGEAFSDVVLKLSLQIENQRLDRLDTSAADATLKEFANRSEAVIKSMTDRMQAAFDGIRFPAPPAYDGGGGGGGSRGGGSRGGGGRRAPVAPQRSYDNFTDPRFGPTSKPEERLRLAPIDSSDLIGRKVADDSQRIAKLNSVFGDLNDKTHIAAAHQRALSKEFETQEEIVARMSAGQASQIRAVEAVDTGNVRLAGTLGKVSNAAAIAVVGYRALTQVNGEHVNVLGQYEGAIESSAIGLSLFGRGASTAASLAGKFGVAVSAGSVALAAIPFATAVAGFKMLADAKAELARQEQINLALDERIAAGNELRRQRELAQTARWADAMIGHRRRVLAHEQSSSRFERAIDARNRQISLTSDPAQRLAEYEKDQGLLEMEERNIGRQRSEVQGRYNDRVKAGDVEGANRAAAQAVALAEREEILERKQTANAEARLAIIKETYDTKRRDLQEGLSDAERAESEQKDFAGLTFAEKQRRKRSGDIPAAPERSSASINAEMAKLDAEYKKDSDKITEYLKSQANSEVEKLDSLNDAVALMDANKEATKSLYEKLAENFRQEKAAKEKLQRELDELRGSIARNNGRGK